MDDANELRNPEVRPRAGGSAAVDLRRKTGDIRIPASTGLDGVVWGKRHAVPDHSHGIIAKTIGAVPEIGAPGP